MIYFSYLDTGFTIHAAFVSKLKQCFSVYVPEIVFPFKNEPAKP